MAGLYRRGVQRNANAPVQIQGSKGSGGATPRGAALPQPSQDDAKQATEDAKTLGGLLGMMQKQKQAQNEIAPELAAADQATANISALPDPASGVGVSPVASANGEWGGVQMGLSDSGIPASDGKWKLSGANDSLALSSTPSMSGVALPASNVGDVPAIANVGQNFTQAGQNATGAAMNAAKAVSEVQPQNMLDMIKNGWGAVSNFFI